MKYDVGDEVLLAHSGETGQVATELFVLVGITTVDNEALAWTVKYPIGTIL